MAVQHDLARPQICQKKYLAGRLKFWSTLNSFIYLSFFSQLATTVGKSALDVASAAMTAQDKITAAAMAAPAKIYRFKRKKKREKKEKEITEKDPRCHGCARQHLKRRGKNEKLKKLLHPPLIFGTKS